MAEFQFFWYNIILKTHAYFNKGAKMKKKEIVLKSSNDCELMTFLIENLKGKSRNNIKSLLLHRQISINGRPVSQYNHIVKEGQEVVVNFDKQRVDNNVNGFEILFEDEDIIVITKPVGLLSIATDKEKERTAYNILKDHVKGQDEKNKIFIVHRLDKGTSGVMVFAKNPKAQHVLQTEWKKRVQERTYVAVVEGRVKDDSDTIVSYLKENKAYVTYSVSENDKEGKKAVTHYKVLKRNKKYSLVELKLGTGRKNQIRCHMKELGYSIVGDKKYGAQTNPINRLGLHALSLIFKHPITDKIMRFDTRIPNKFTTLVK